ncbi:AAA family ATPase [Flavobacterium sp. Fl-318]|uniref:AAA family ATPase n=1 Tax=Flavobacterium cupriresistens TaxID=2893885 RepID=A0ABU4R6Q1_9FLAO|nr:MULTISPECIES: AAA family ATPase [unclassified Flavobacterium]MDX6187901.1 AAA family ATPase [Flavobacterium sp. Fl-318]UFH42179.1 AAA family ATPase [Flavobacterium sp. F-323]
MKSTEKLNNVLQHIKDVFVGKNEIIDLLGIGLLARENAFLLGPPGTAKSALVRALSNGIEGGKNFEYLLTRFTEPNEIFGPFDIRKLKEGELVTNTEGMMPEASMIFLDEIFNANSAILNSLLLALNEKIFRRGRETKKLPALMFIGASNVLPEDEALNALLDRFLIRVKCDYVDPDLLHEVLLAGWKIESSGNKEIPTITADEIRELQSLCRTIDLTGIRKQYVDIVHNLRNTGIKVSDRRAVKLQNLIAASALMCGREEAVLSDLWVLKYIWDNEEQIEILEGIINQTIEKDDSDGQHPQALYNKVPNPEEVMKEMQHLTERWQDESLSFEEQNVIKDKLRYLQSRCDWINNKEQKQYIQKEIEALWQKILQTV